MVSTATEQVSAGVGGAAAGIEIRGLTVKYGDTVAVDDLSLTIQHGEMLVLLGPSGCGKTSTMRSIVGLETPTAGTISVGGKAVFDAQGGVNIPPNKRDIGMVFQSYAIWPHKTVFQNVVFPLRMQKIPKRDARERVEQMLDLVGLKGMGSRGASMLSGGQMQRVALARSLVMRPKVLLLDEPLSNLDAKLRDRLRFELKELQQAVGVTSVYVTHDQSEALALADRVAVMKSGVIQQLDGPMTIYEDPHSTFVANFLGVTNLFSGDVVPTNAPNLHTINLRDARMQISAEGDPPEDSHISACIRPDAINISRWEGSRGNERNTWKGTIAAANFLGTHVRYRIELEAGPSLDAVVFARNGIYARGDNVAAQVEPRDVQLLAE